MVDIGDKKSKKDKDKKKGSFSKSKKKSKKKKKKKKKSGNSSGSSGGEDTSPFEMGDDAIPDVSEASVGDTSQRWASEGAELNFGVGVGGGTKSYIKNQISECEEFYDDFADTATSNIEDINQFTLYFHAITLAMARNRMGIRDTLIDRFGKSQKEAISITNEICERAGEVEAYNEVIMALMKRLDEE